MPFDVERFTGEGKPLKFDPFMFSFLGLLGGCLIFYGAYSAIRLAETIELPTTPLLTALIPLLGALAAAVMVYSFLYSIHKTGMEGVILSAGLVYLLVASVLAVIIPGFGIIIGVMGFMIIGGLWFSTGPARERARRFLEAVVEVMMEEKELVLPTFVFFILSAYLLLSYVGFLDEFGILDFVPGNNGGYNIGHLDAIPFLISLFAFIYLQQVVFLFLMGIVVGITYIWYRGKDPELKDGVHLVLHRLDPITEFAAYAAVYHTIQAALILFGRIGGVIAAKIMDLVWGAVNYFSLQTVVITGRRAPQAIKLSARLLSRNIPDVLVKEVFVDNGIEFIFRIMSFPIYFIGFGLVFLTGDTALAPLFIYSASVIFGVFIFTMNYVYRTFLFAWALEKELGKDAGGRMPKGMEEVIERIQLEGGRTDEVGKLAYRERGDRGPAEDRFGTDWSYMTKTRGKRDR